MKLAEAFTRKSRTPQTRRASLRQRLPGGALAALMLFQGLLLFGCDAKPDPQTPAEGSPSISINEEGYWVINGEATDVKAEATDGKDGANGKDGKDGAHGVNGTDGKDGATWTVGTEFPATAKENDLFLNSASWVIYQYDGAEWVVKGSLKGEEETEMVMDLVMFMGQSNMAGRGDYKLAPEVPAGHGFEFRAVTDPEKLYGIGSQAFGKNENRGVISESSKTGSMVPALMNSYYAHTGVPIVGVSASKGGTSIDWWQPGGQALNEAIARYQAAKAYLLENGYTIRHQYMVWCQGETDGDKNMSKDTYKTRLIKTVDEMHAQGIEKTLMVRIGNHRDDAVKYDEIMLAQTELCAEHDDVVMISAKLAGMAAAGLMKDTFHYTQEGYNAVGADAGKNMAYYVNTGMEPYFYDSEFGRYHPFGGGTAPDADEDTGTAEPPAASGNVVVSVADKTHDFSKVGTVSGDKVTVTAKSASNKVALTEAAVLSDDYSWTVEMVVGNMTGGTTVLASVGGSEATGFITVPNTVPSKAGDTAQFRFRDLGRSCQVDFTIPSDFDPAAKHHLAITFDAATKTFKAYLDKQELAVKYTVGSQAKGFNDTPISCLLGGYKTTEYNFQGDFYYFAFHKKVLTTDEMYTAG